MKRQLVLVCFWLPFFASQHDTALAQLVHANPEFAVRHTVVFKLKYSTGSPEEKEFLTAAKKLSSIPGVHNFESLRQTSKKNNFDFGLTMEFDTVKAYEEYSKHPDHVAFVQTYWVKAVKDFMEIDYEPLK
jgi:heme-degrading monooxygenase HmoA